MYIKFNIPKHYIYILHFYYVQLNQNNEKIRQFFKIIYIF